MRREQPYRQALHSIRSSVCTVSVQAIRGATIRRISQDANVNVRACALRGYPNDHLPPPRSDPGAPILRATRLLLRPMQSTRWRRSNEKARFHRCISADIGGRTGLCSQHTTGMKHIAWTIPSGVIDPAKRARPEHQAAVRFLISGRITASVLCRPRQLPNR